MQRTTWNHRTWLRKLAWYLRDDSDNVSFNQAIYPEQQFREELARERQRAERSNKAMVLMLIDTEAIIGLEPEEEQIAESVVDELSNCVRATDICGQLKEGVLVGVILTEIKPEMIETAQLRIAMKTREKLISLLGEELAHRVSITFNVVNPAGIPSVSDVALTDDRRGQAAATWSRLSHAGEADPPEPIEIYRSLHRRQ